MTISTLATKGILKINHNRSSRAYDQKHVRTQCTETDVNPVMNEWISSILQALNNCCSLAQFSLMHDQIFSSMIVRWSTLETLRFCIDSCSAKFTQKVCNLTTKTSDKSVELPGLVQTLISGRIGTREAPVSASRLSTGTNTTKIIICLNMYGGQCYLKC